MERLKDNYIVTGKQPGELTKPELDALVADTDYKWFETAIIDQRFFNSMFAYPKRALFSVARCGG